MNSPALTPQDTGALVESVIVKGDLAKLTPHERTQYYVRVCDSLGLNPLTRPFEFLTLNNKLTLYATRACTDQLRNIYGVSVVEMTEAERDGIFIVTAKVQNAQGRTDIAKGAVNIGSLKGEALANAVMKTETKAKRRATLSICGLGFLDELEVETIPQEARKSSASAKREDAWATFQHELSECQSAVSLERLRKEYQANVYPTWPGAWPAQAEEEFEKKLASFSAGEALGQTLVDSVDKETGEITSSPAAVASDQHATKAEFVQSWHDEVAIANDAQALVKAWNADAAARRRFSLTKAESDELKERVMAKAKELAYPRDKAGNQLSVLDAG